MRSGVATLCLLVVGSTCAFAGEPAPVLQYEPPVRVEHGSQRPVMDGLGWLIGIPNKLLLWDRRADNHDVSQETVADAAQFLSENEVDGVLVRVNQYDPLGEWRRLMENDRVGIGWRATLGSAYTIGYSLLPGRLVGGDWYNPYTDTVHVYSDIPAIAMEQAAHAADTHDRSHPGFYSATRLLPLVGLVHEARSKEAVFEYVDQHGTLEERVEARKVLHAQLGSEVGGQAAVFAAQGDAIVKLGGAAIGHVVGRYQASRITAEPRPTAEGPVQTGDQGPLVQ